LRPGNRLHAPRDFQRLLRHGLRLEGRLFLLLALENGRPRDRLGLVLPRTLGAAVQRNRLRRLAREAFRTSRRATGVGVDLLLKPRREMLVCTSDEVRDELEDRLRRLRSRVDRRTGPVGRT